ncbi:MAG: TRAP transporter substrate-binding protein DctP [Chloroflexi bacterium]|nr:TRAP transporter substrate-binding protein DctP [Ardenticatenaceae bacterium]MBL1128208.1 ABC transporter substrate-binding protein [Chloroflexota bacterium]NOG34280.1 TRAP transporter substrate-binding protein DctP [Chloroflexota bacterium]GIK56394.1 MAG: C4-dicarboxylate ABC transporter [Chloroflexota bacterium]
MNRREFLGLASKSAAGAATMGLVSCGAEDETANTPTSIAATTAPSVADETTLTEAAQTDTALPNIEWQMATSWPVALDTIFGGAEIFAQRVAAMTGGKFVITPRAAGELAPGLEVLNVVEQGAVTAGHTASYYYVGKSPVTAFGTALPFGLTARQQNAWFYEGGGLELLQQYYRDRFNVIQFPAGNTGAQMGGWFKKEISTPADLQGLKMRIPGLGGQVMNKLGVTVQVVAGGEIFQALQTGAIDAAEWVGPYDDEKLGLNDAAQFYYSPGWWEPGPALEVQINLSEWNKLPEVYQEIVRTAAFQANTQMLARYDARNKEALERLIQGGTQLRSFSQEILEASEQAAFALFDEFSQADSDFKSIFEQWKKFRDDIQIWHSVNETDYMKYIEAQTGQ